MEAHRRKRKQGKKNKIVKKKKNRQSELHFCFYCKSRRSESRAARSHASSAMGHLDFSRRPMTRYHFSVMGLSHATILFQTAK